MREKELVQKVILFLANLNVDCDGLQSENKVIRAIFYLKTTSIIQSKNMYSYIE